jgi:integrase
LTRDASDILQHFLRPASITLGSYGRDSFHSLRREALTGIGSVLGIGQAMKMAGHSSIDITMVYQLEDKAERERGVRAFQERILGKPEGPVQ